MTDKPPDDADEVVDSGPPAGTWLAYAEADLHAARALAAELTVAPWVPAFHCQQAAEKALKAVLIAHEQRVPKIHGLIALYAAIPEPRIPAMLATGDLARLQPWAVVGRYPGDIPEPGRSELTDLLGIAAEVVRLAGDSVARQLQQMTEPAEGAGGE